MKTHIMLLRGVTPTGKNKVLMAPLHTALETAGLTDVRTYIQSGNIVAASNLSQPELEKLVHHVIKKCFGGNIAVVARTVTQFRNVLARNPFNNADTAKLYFTFLAMKPENRLVEEFLAPGYAPDEVKVIANTVYVLCASKYRDLKANNNFIERKLGVVATTRVYNTVSKLCELSME